MTIKCAGKLQAGVQVTLSADPSDIEHVTWSA
jgi:hypothetical protein